MYVVNEIKEKIDFSSIGNIRTKGMFDLYVVYVQGICIYRAMLRVCHMLYRLHSYVYYNYIRRVKILLLYVDR